MGKIAGTARIRPAAMADLAPLLDLLDQLREGATPRVPWERANEQRASEILAGILEHPGRTLLVAELDGETVGTLDLFIHQNLTHGGAPVAVVENVVVDVIHRGRGIGRALLENAIERARAAGCYKVQLSSNRERTGAHAFYRSVGLEPSAEGFRRYLSAGP